MSSPAEGAWKAALVWLAACPVALPEPHIAVGDDGSVVMEWVVQTRTLGVSFDDEGAGAMVLVDVDKHTSVFVEDLSADPHQARLMLRILRNGHPTED